MVESAIIIDNEGNTIHSLSTGDLHPDTALLGGFLSALQDFSDMVSGDAVQEMEMGEYRFLVSSILDYHLITIHAIKSANPKRIHEEILALCEKNRDSLKDRMFKGRLKRLVESLSNNEKA
ncbi:MAG: hypothetical protein GF309_16015 [Candidatus Lokiarchaeota archaeon]|nr:hypothetical protein [Candidatus Lokiarchaeota archaeon]